MKNLLRDNKRFALITSFFAVILLFSPFWGQWMYSDVVTFSRTGDTVDQCYPEFVRLGVRLCNGNWGGYEYYVYNGASEFFSRAGSPSYYLPFAFFSAIGYLLSKPYFMYILYHVFHIFIALYFTQRLAMEFFKLKKEVALLIGIYCMSIWTEEVWFHSFFTIACLTFPLLYYSLRTIKNTDRHIFLRALPYVLALTSGYIVISVVLFGTVAVASVCYYWFFENERKLIKYWYGIIFPAIVGMIISIAYCLNLYIYISKVVKNDLSSMFSATYFVLNIKDLVRILSSSFTPENMIEQLRLITLGIPLVLIVIYAIREHAFNRMNHGMRVVFLLSLAIVTILCMISMNQNTPLAFWFYNIPVIGQAHLPIRFLIIYQQYFLLVLFFLIGNLENEREKKFFKVVILGGSVIFILLFFYSRINTVTIFNDTNLLFELMTSIIIFYCAYIWGIVNIKTLLVWASLIFIINSNTFYTSQEVKIPIDNYKSRNILFNEEDQKVLTNFVESQFEKKLFYRYICVDSNNEIHTYMGQSYPWINTGNVRLSNYVGYPLHMTGPKEYFTDNFPWFDNINWEYLKNTRADFLVLDNSYITENKELLDQYVDWDLSNVYLNYGRLRLCVFKRFIPSGFGVVNDLVSADRVLDNGFFYSPQLDKSQMINFSAIDGSFVKATFILEKSADVEFLFFAGNKYKFYVNGNEMSPRIEGDCAYMNLEKGKNIVEIRYSNILQSIAIYVICIYYIFVIITILIMFVKTKLKLSNIKI